MTNSTTNRPTHRLYLDNAHWTPIGAAWVHKDGKGFSLSLDAMPLGGRITMREISERENGGQS